MEELLLVLAVGVLVLGPWVLGVVALVRANRALRIARDAAAPLPTAIATAIPTATSSAAPTPTSTPTPTATPTSTATATATATSTAPPAPAPTATPRPPRGPALEEKIALVWFTRAGAIAVLVGAAYFLKYAYDNSWIGPWGRIAMASLWGVVALVAGEALRARTRAAWIHALQGAGLALLFLAAFGSHALYGLVPPAVAFAAVAAVALLGGALALRHRAELLLGLALAGGLLAPVFLSTGEDRPLALFGYLLVLGAAALAVSARAGFQIVPWLALVGTSAVFAGWYDAYFKVAPPAWVPDASVPIDEQMGAYYPLARRAIPLGAAIAFSAAWLAAHRRFRRSAPRLWADAWLGVSLLYATWVPFGLLWDRPLLGGAALAASAAVSALLLAEARRPALVVALEAVAFGLLWHSADARASGGRAWIAAAALVAAAHLAAIAREWLVRREAPSPWRTGAAAAAGLAFAAFAIWLTEPREGVLRAALVGAAAVAELGLGAAVLARARARASVLLGASLGLLAGAAAFLLSGASVTVVWAAMGAVAAVLGARERDRLWVAGACALLAAAAGRAVTLDVLGVPRAAARFLATMGAEGRLEPAFVLNPRALALAAVAAALLVAARAIARAAPAPGARPAAGVLAAAGWATAIALVVLEARDLALVLPLPPAPGDADAWDLFASAVAEARADQHGGVSAVTSLVLACSAALLVGGGFWFRDALHRWLGLGTFGIVFAKLLLSDVWSLARLQQVAVFLGVGVLLLGAAFLYARHGRRLAGLLRDERPPGAGGAALGLLLLVALPARALDPTAFRTVRPVEGVAAPGLHAVEADADLLRASRAAPGALADVRVQGPDGAEVPWTLRLAPDPSDRQLPCAVVDPVTLPDGSVRAVLDLGRRPPRHSDLELDLEGEEFLRPVKLEVSADGRRWGTLSRGQRVWAIRDLPDARHTSVSHPVSEARFVRVTLLAGAGAPPRIAGARVWLGDSGPAPMQSVEVAVPVARRSADGRETLLDVDLGAAGLPVEAIELEAATPAFERHVRVQASADAAHWVPAGGGVVWRVPPPAAAAPDDAVEATNLRVAAATGARRHVRISISDGDSAPLAVSGLRVLWRPREVLFRAERAGPHRLLVGGDVPAPAYDLAALLARTGDEAAAATLGPAAANAAFREREPDLPFTERHRVALSAGLAVLFAGLALWAVRLMRRPLGGGDAGSHP